MSRIERRRTAALDAWRIGRDMGRHAGDIIGSLIVMAVIAAMFGAFSGPVRADAPSDWPQAARIGAGGVCTFAGRIEARERVEAVCLTGLISATTVIAQIETNSPLLSGWVNQASPDFVSIVLRNEMDMPLIVRDVQVRVALVTPLQGHVCSLPPPPQPWTLRDKCVQAACAAGREPTLCLIKTGAPGAGTPGAD